MATPDLDVLAAATAVTTAPALVTAVHNDDAHMVEKILTGLDRQRLYALAVVLAAQNPKVPPRPREQTLAERRMEDYAFMPSTGASIPEAAARIGVSELHAEKHYEPLYLEGSAA